MRTMFVKLFFWFCLASVLSGGVFFLIAFNVRLRPMHAGHGNRFSDDYRHLLGSALSVYGQGAALLWEKGAPLPAAPAGDPRAAKVYLFTADGTPLSPGTPLRLAAQLRRVALTSGAGPVPDGGPDLVVARVTGPSGRNYLAATDGPTFQPHPPHPGFLIPPDAWLNLAITLLISGMVCYLLAWRLTVPIRRLRGATRSLAAGDLAARVKLSRERGGDELSELGGEFNRMAERLEKLVNSHRRLLRDVSHELRSPLARLGVALGLARKLSSVTAEPALDRIEQEAERLNLMIGELLELSRLEGGEGTIPFAPLDLAALVKEIVRDADFEAQGLARRVTLFPAAAVEVSGNRELLRRALENVVRNGIRYTCEGSAVEVSLEVEGAKVRVSVRDRGPGVPEAQLADIFRPFYRVAEARDRSSGGTGIGLAISEETVVLHGGSISARNAADGGLVVEIGLPHL